MTESDDKPDPFLNAYRPDLAAAELSGRVSAARFTEGRPAGIISSLADLRREPQAAARLDTQLLFGEAVTVYDERDGWAWVQNETDRYVGYVESATLGGTPKPPTHQVSALRSYLFPEPDLKAPPLGCLSIASPLRVVGEEGDYAALGDGRFVYRKHTASLLEGIERDYVATALRFLGTPYYWGGRSSIGLDCAALIQLCLARAGMPVLRDSYMQGNSVGRAVDWQPGETKLQRGDLVYFPGHCVIMLDDREVVHANAFTMSVAIETLEAVEQRVIAESGGTGITGIRRVLSGS
ncbi:C40 family peptidase [Pelagibius litoralis]|uniref:C40 family peptidase n=1 Tax=Pelagibius litoralis TaxID=374515 RepID=A0A967EY51_9PROT|nr:NlpC/P60 family protein [Pelagibius litoralis]NIA69559.1 C40 family peptidase [Pelagibius litoralis]